MKNRIFMISHINTRIQPTEVFPILYVGPNAKYEWVTSNVYLDNTGDNLSKDNPVYNEMSGIYWVWKHYEEVGNPDFVGFMHYRRFFLFEESKYAYFEQDISPNDIGDLIKYSPSVLDNIDFIIPTPYKRLNVKRSYNIAHHKEDIPLALNILKSLYPQDYRIAIDYLNGKSMYFNNMFIFKKELFFDYCNWIFPILFKFVELNNHKTDRLFISEILTGIFFRKLINAGKRVKNYPTLFIADKKPTFKESVNMCKSNFKTKNYGFIYSLKPIIKFFIPRSIWIKRQRKAAKTL